MTKRTSKKVVSNVSVDQYNEALSEYAVADAREQKINATLDEQFTKLREKYADELARIVDVKNASFEVVQRYSEENYDALFSKKKSVETTHGVIGFRTGTPKLKTRKGFTWAAVLELLKVKLPSYVRVKEEPNKELLLVNREQISSTMPEIGLEVVQDETFFIELKKEDA